MNLPRRWHDNDGRLHRVDGPAIIRSNGTAEWRQHGFPHRGDGPALTLADGTELWYLDGYAHRVDGPAVVDPNGWVEWWVKGVRLSRRRFRRLQLVVT